MTKLKFKGMYMYWWDSMVYDKFTSSNLLTFNCSWKVWTSPLVSDNCIEVINYTWLKLCHPDTCWIKCKYICISTYHTQFPSPIQITKVKVYTQNPKMRLYKDECNTIGTATIKVFGKMHLVRGWGVMWGPRNSLLLWTHWRFTTSIRKAILQHGKFEFSTISDLGNKHSMILKYS